MGVATLLLTPLTVAEPSGVNNASFELVAASSFITAIGGLPSCAPSVVGDSSIIGGIVTTSLATTSPAFTGLSNSTTTTSFRRTSLSSSLLTFTSSPSPSTTTSSLSTNAKVGIGVEVSIGALGLLMLGTGRYISHAQSQTAAAYKAIATTGD